MGKQLTLDCVGPKSDVGQVMCALAARLLSQEIASHVAATLHLMEWEGGRVTGSNPYGSVKTARRAVLKHEVRVIAARRLVTLADMATRDDQGRMVPDAPESPVASNLGDVDGGMALSTTGAVPAIP